MKIKELEKTAIKTLQDLLSKKNRSKDNRLSTPITVLEFIKEEKEEKSAKDNTIKGY